MTTDLSRLDGVVDESTLLHTWFDPATQELVLHLGILAHPKAGGEGRPERLILLKHVARITVWLRDLKKIEHPPSEGFPGFGHAWMSFEPISPPVPLSTTTELIDAMNSYSPELYWLPERVFDDPVPPDWLSHPALTSPLRHLGTTPCTSGSIRIRVSAIES